MITLALYGVPLAELHHVRREVRSAWLFGNANAEWVAWDLLQYIGRVHTARYMRGLG